MAKIVSFPMRKPPPTREELMQKVKELAEDLDKNLRFDPHFRDRLWQRKITMRQVLETIKNGDAVHGPTLDQYGDWRLLLRLYVAGTRVRVAIVVKDDYLLAVTVI